VTALSFISPPRAGRSATLVVKAMAGAAGRILSLDVRWGDGQRDHFTFAPGDHMATISHRFRHRYKSARSYRMRATARAEAGSCRADSAPRRLTVNVG
jgi:hypothetical protein